MKQAQLPTCSTVEEVASLAEAWIETVDYAGFVQGDQVASLAEAWIETSETMVNLVMLRRLPRGGVD